MKKTKLTIISVIVLSLTALIANAAVSVQNIKVQQRYPWNGQVDIEYEIVSDKPEVEYSVHAQGRDNSTGKYITMRALSGDGVAAKVKAGRHHLIWDLKADAPTLVTKNFAVSLQAVAGLAPYAVVDLSPGPDAPAYPVTYLGAIPEGGWTDAHKTNLLVLRLIMPDTFLMGSPDTEVGRSTNETHHTVILTQPYYIGVFEVTQKQWELVLRSNPSAMKGDMRPVDYVYYHAIRGSSSGVQWPVSNAVDSTSFMGLLRAKTPLLFDLPTEAQWENACRAGTITALNNGKGATSDILSLLGRFVGNLSDGRGGGYGEHTKVGSYEPNAWGLYDMHGNVEEWCRDLYQEDLGTAAVTDPKGAPLEQSNGHRVLRGGNWRGSSSRSAQRNSQVMWAGSDYYGFRTIILPTAP